MAERDRAAVHVQLLVRDPELAACRRAPAPRTPRSARRGRCRRSRGPPARAPCGSPGPGRRPCRRGRRRRRRSRRSAPAAPCPSASARSSLASTTQAAPSLSVRGVAGGDGPALAERPAAGARASRASCPRAGPRRRGRSPGRPSAAGPAPARSRRRSGPASAAATARRWLSSANSSWSSRETP